jgi:beta-fructofuranosidase
LSNALQPGYHFRPSAQWINDPNGPIQVNGEYHLFYQYNPHADHWETMHWGHAKSRDLVHWEHLPIALYPSNALGETHCFSGCTVLDVDGRPAILYTSIGPGVRNPTSGAEQWLAYGTPDLLTWAKYEKNPVMTSATSEGRVIMEWRDPFVWREDGVWYMVCGGSYQDRGCVALYCAQDLTSWKFVSVVADGEERIWECPSLFRLGDRWVLLYSPDVADNRVRYRIGVMDASWKFVAESQGILDHGGRQGFYAPTTFLDEKGRRILLGWMPETARGAYKDIRGWSGVHAVPRELQLTADRRLQIVPIPELEGLRERPQQLEAMPLPSGIVDTGVHGDMLELSAVFAPPQDAAPFGLSLLRSDDGKEETRLVVDMCAKCIRLDRHRSSLYEGVHRFEQEMPLPGLEDGLLRLRVFLDRSTIEVFANDTAVLSSRVYPSLDSSKGVSLLSEAPGVALVSLNAWTLRSIWVADAK